MATQADLDRAKAWADAQVGKPYVLGAFGSSFDCSTYMSGIATMIRDGVAARWFTTHPFHGGAQNPLPGWERDLEAPFMMGITDADIGHTGGTLLGVEYEATAAGNRVVRSGSIARGAHDPMFKWLYGFRPSLLESSQAPATLRSAGAKHNIYMGAAVADHLFNSTAARNTLASHYSSLTAENVMKWGNIHPQRDTYNWAAADRLVDFAEQNGQVVHGHTLVWHTELPSWTGPSDLESHIKTIVGRYKGRIKSWDVVNEVLDESGNLRNMWYKDMIADAFRWAHEADPDALLFINDYNIETNRTKTDGMFNFVKSLLAQGVPLHGVGFQCHFNTDWTPAGELEGNMKRFAALGLKVAVTEFDCALKSGGTLTAQANHYKNMVNASLALGTSMYAFTTWGFTDGSTWLTGQAPLPFDANYQPKPALNSMIQALGSTPSTTPPAITAASLKAMASGGTRISNGTYAQGSTSAVSVMSKNNAVHFTSGMSIDCDGQPGTKCNSNTDPYFQPDTSWHQSDGQALKAETLPFIVLPLPSDTWDYSTAGIVGGNLCTVVYGNNYVHAVVGDQGPRERIGEASYATAERLGIPSSPTSGGVGSGVTYIVYPGVKVNPIESASEAHRLGQIEAAKWLGLNQGEDTHTVVAGDTFSSIATAHGVSMDELAIYNNLIVPGSPLIVEDPVVLPPDPTLRTYVARTGDTWSSIATAHSITVDKLMTLNNITVAPGSSYIVGIITAPAPVDPYVNGLPQINQTSPSAMALQAELKRVGYMSTTVTSADNYGPKTQEAVAAFHNDNQQFRMAVYDPQIGQMGWVYLRGMASGTGRTTAPTNTAGKIDSSQVLFTSTSSMSGKTFAEDTIRTTLALMGLPVTTAWLNGYLTIALRESSYNPNAVNTYDSNAIGPIASDGNPFQCSRGMWQCIPQTFATYHQSGTSLSIYDPVASCAASMNYVRSRYGVLNDGSNLATKVQQANPDLPPKGY